MEGLYISIAILFLLFFTAWNIFAVVGIVLTLKFFIEKYSKGKKVKTKVSPEEKGKDGVVEQVQKKKPPDIQDQKKKPPDMQDQKDKSPEIPDLKKKEGEKKTKKKIKSPFDTSTILLYTGAFLVGFATFVFVAFNWESFSDSIKTALIIGIVLFFYLLGYLFSLKREYFKVSKTFILLGSISIAFAGVGIWKFYIETNIPSLRVVDYGFIYSLFLTSVYAITYLAYRSKLYFLFGLAATYGVILFSAPAFVSEPKYRISYMLVASVGLLTLSYLLFNKRNLYKKLAEPIMRFVVIFFNILNITMIADNIFRINSSQDKILATTSLFVSFLVILIIYREKKKVIAEPVVEGFLLPFKLFLISNLLYIDAGSYHFLAISLILFIIAFAVSMRKEFQNPTIKAFTLPLLITTTALNLILPFLKPVYVQVWDSLPIALTYMVLSIAVQIKSSSDKYRWGRLLNIPLDMAAFIFFILAIEQRLHIGLDEAYIIGFLLLIPTVIYTAEWLLTKPRRKPPLLIGAISFFTVATLLSVDVSEPLFIFAISAIGVVYYLALIISSNKHFFVVPLMIYAFLNATAAFVLFEYNEAIWIASLIGLLLFFGNLWRLDGNSKSLAGKSYLLAQRTSILFAFPITGLLLITIFESDNLITLLNSVLLSIFAFTVRGSKSIFKYLAGVGLTLGFWWLIQRSDTPIYANAQIYAFPVVIYLLILAFISYSKNKTLSTIFKISAFLLPMTIALIQSITDPEPYNLYHGLLLLTVATTILIYSVLKKDKLLTGISIVYIVIELFILLWDLILSIPWWIYVGMLGMGLIAMSVYIIYRLSKSVNSPQDISKKH